VKDLRGRIRQIAPQFFATDMRATLTYYTDKLGFDLLGTWQDPPVYAIVARDEHRIHFRCADAPTPNPDKYDDELLDAYFFVDECGRVIRRVRGARRGVHARAWQHTLAFAGIRGEGL
jgi:catechol 2,3-dioxygenase-like lactoylglutathione lyase family enzyme